MARFPKLRTRSLDVPAKDGTLIAVECAGTGPSLVIVHGGIGDRSRWKPLLQIFDSELRSLVRWTVVAMVPKVMMRPIRRCEKGAEDVAAVANAQPGRVSFLGHSIGGV